MFSFLCAFLIASGISAVQSTATRLPLTLSLPTLKPLFFGLCVGIERKARHSHNKRCTNHLYFNVENTPKACFLLCAFLYATTPSDVHQYASRSCSHILYSLFPLSVYFSWHRTKGTKLNSSTCANKKQKSVANATLLLFFRHR